jgi:hypothetical protein
LLRIALARAERVEKRWHIVDRVRRTLSRTEKNALVIPTLFAQIGGKSVNVAPG